VSPPDPNLDRIELVAAALGPLRDQLVFVGGCAAGLLISDPAATPIRATLDVDLVVQVTALAAYHKVEKEFVKLGFTRDMTQDAPVCRWIYRNIEVDLMPTDEKILGFANRWYPLALETARSKTLPSGMSIRLINAPTFLGTKFEAFNGRGRGNLLGSHDLEDILNVIAGRSELIDELAGTPAILRRYLGDQCRALIAMPDFESYLPGLIRDDAYGELSDYVLERMRLIMGVGSIGAGS
jgi:predicted nucleotidyltransferase